MLGSGSESTTVLASPAVVVIETAPTAVRLKKLRLPFAEVVSCADCASEAVRSIVNSFLAALIIFFTILSPVYYLGSSKLWNINTLSG